MKSQVCQMACSAHRQAQLFGRLGLRLPSTALACRGFLPVCSEYCRMEAVMNTSGRDSLPGVPGSRAWSMLVSLPC